MHVSEHMAMKFGALAEKVLNPKQQGMLALGSHLDALGQDVNLESAFRSVEHKVPSEVAALLQHQQKPHKVEGLDSKSFDKARIALNELVEKAWVELDDKIFKCKGFEDMNRENYDQVHRDMMRLLEQVNDLERIESEGIESVGQLDQEILNIEGQLETATKNYNQDRAQDDQELAVRNSDLDVFAFILKFTKCEDATSFAQVCEMQSGRRTLLFHDSAAAKQFARMMKRSPRSRKSVDHILQLYQKQLPGNITLPPKDATPVKGEDGLPCASGSMGGEDNCMKGCGPDTTPDCALLHDKLSLMWGDFKDKVDELTMDMMRKQYEFEELKTNLNDQISILTKKKATMNQLLAEARSNMASDRAEIKEKQHQMRVLDIQYQEYMTKCHKRITWILYQDMCAIKVVRNAVLNGASSCPTDEIQDCDVDAWVPEDCSVSCDDKCDPSRPFECGGWQKMTRQVVVPNDDCGIKCPATEKYKRCGQYKCPVDCVMSEWSGWSKCTAECEGGLESHTRSILVKPKNGGMACNTAEESQACATGSCDRNCKLSRWTSWSPCSVSCGGGFQEKFRHVAVPIRGDGICPGADSRFRYGKRSCNEHDCNGDEICVAKQDLIIAIDASGSVREKGFEVIKKFVTTLLERYEPEYWGDEGVQLGIVQFGNGVLGEDGRTVSPARSIHALSFDHATVKEAVGEMKFKKGFTNMAQAFSMAEDMIITDGKPSFSFMTSEMVEQLDDKGIMRYFFVISDEGEESDTMKLIKSWASQPWQTNVVHVHGMAVLEADPYLWVEKSVTRFCPFAYSPGAGEWEEMSYGYIHVKNGGWCGDQGEKLSGNVGNVDECAALAVGAGAQAFLEGKSFRDGTCIASTMEVDQKTFDAWDTNRADPPCEDGWHSSVFFDFYAIIPMEE
jgi:uncharacterized protein YegL